MHVSLEEKAGKLKPTSAAIKSACFIQYSSYFYAERKLFSELGLPVVGMGQLGGKLCSADVQKMTTARKVAASGGKDILSASLPEISRDKILSDFPLHWHVWHKDSSSLEEELALNKVCVQAYFVDSVLTASRQNTINSFSPSVCGLYAA